MSLTKVSYSMINGAPVNVLDFGADPTGVNDSWSAFQAAHDSLSASNSYVGGLIVIPTGKYYLSKTWDISKRVTIQGTNPGDQPDTAACILEFPADTNGIFFHGPYDSPTGTSATQSVLQFVQVHAKAKNSSGVGIKCTTTVRIEYCQVRSFKSHGIEFYGQTGGPSPTGVADFWKVSNTRISDCGGNGLYAHGDDSQIGIASQVECMTNGNYGFYDVSAYGNTYIACQAGGNTTGSYYGKSTLTYYGSVYIGCYVEFGTGQTAVFDDDSIILGGVLAAVAGDGFNFANRYPGGSGPNVSTNGRHMWFRDNSEIARIDTDNVLYGFPKIVLGTSGSNYISEGLSQAYNAGTGLSECWRFRNDNGTVGGITTNGTATAYNTSSDYRLKENVQPMTNALQKIVALNPCTFTWKTDGSAGQGFIAHELQAVVPDCVTGEKDAVDKDGKPIYQGVDTSFLVATLVAAIKELKEEFESYKSTHS